MIVYKITFPNDKMYIGCTSRALSERQKCHKSYAKNDPRTTVHHAINKYGWNSLKWEVLEKCSSIEEMHFLEKYYIKFYNSKLNFNGYNATDGGEGTIGSKHNLGRKHSEKTNDYNRKIKTKLFGKRVVLINRYTKTFNYFDSIGAAARYSKVETIHFKTSRKTGNWYKEFKLIDADKFNETSPNNFHKKTSANSIEFKITNGQEIVEIKSINQLRKFLNISERIARNIYYKKYVVQDWKKYE